MKILHMAIYDRNIGDNALNYVIDNEFSSWGDYETRSIFQKVFTEDDIEDLNKYDLIIIGGGGYLTTHNCVKNKAMKWGSIFRIPNNLLKKINTKMVFYGWGFNHFFNDPPLSSKGVEFLSICKDKGWLFSVRNDESKKRLRSMLDYNVWNYIREIPDSGCLYEIPKVKTNDNLIGCNIALDRHELRYGNVENVRKFVKLINNVVKEKGFDIVYFLHTPPDKKILNFILGLKVVTINNAYDNTNKAWQEYAKCVKVIATRGHGQIINSANNIPTFSIATHPKVLGFASVNNLLDYCWKYDANNLKILKVMLNDFLENKKKKFSDIYRNNVQKWKSQTNAFVKEIKNYVER